MFRTALRASSAPSSVVRATARACRGQRFISTAPPHQKSRSWKSSAARWGLAGAVVYYYNTSPVFADEPRYKVHAPPEVPDESETYETIEVVAEQRKAQARKNESSSNTASSVAVPDDAPAAPGSPEELEEEASQQGAFNEETGEINWDCPCLGGMAYGPCGEQFRAAFSCFVFSKEEPKGVDCIDRFKAMQDCFREHPDIYGGELDFDEDDAQAEPLADRHAPNDAGPDAANTPSPSRDGTAPASSEKGPSQSAGSAEAVTNKREDAQAAKEQVTATSSGERSEAPSAVPKSAHDAR